MKKARKIILLAPLLLLVIAGIQFYIADSRKTLSDVFANSSIQNCYGITPSNDTFVLDDLEAFLNIADDTQIQLDGVDPHMMRSLDDKLYELYISDDTKQYQLSITSESYWIYYKGMRYKISNESKADMIHFLETKGRLLNQPETSND